MAAMNIPVLLLVLVCPAFCQLTDVTVNTPAGTFIGFRTNVSVDESTVLLNKFLGIPYAQPPVGELRFEKPVPKAVLSEPLVVQRHGSECLQILFDTSVPASEDCLFLNVYAPVTTDNSGPLAVMIWIHGGGYVFGSANTYVSDLLAARGNVIVVTLNYRLTALGFLNFGHNRPSNFGLYDQHIAIRWVHDNIGAFGGDTNRVTIFGESAGASSVILQGLYPENRGLFQRIISQSGTPAAQWSESLTPVADAEDFVSFLGCMNSTSVGILDCLKRVPFQRIYEALNDFSNGLYRDPLPYVPSVDNNFIKVRPKDIQNAKNNVGTAERDVLSTFDMLIGGNDAEAASNIDPKYGDPDAFLPNRTFFEETLVPEFITGNQIDGDKGVLAKLLAARYTTWSDPDNLSMVRKNYVNIYSDYLFLVPILLTADLHAHVSRKGPYVYHFTAEPSTHIFPTPNWVGRPNHGDELLYVFGEVNTFNEWATPGPFEDWEKELSRNMMLMWSNFAKTGNPNQPRDIGVNWEPYTRTSKKYLDIARFMNENVTKKNLILDRINLWDRLVPAVNDAMTRASMNCDVSRATHGVTDVTFLAILISLLAVLVI